MLSTEMGRGEWKVAAHPFLFLKCSCWARLEGLGAANVAEAWKDSHFKGT